MYGKKRRSNLNLFVRNAAGEVIYTGEMFRYCGEIPWEKAKLQLFILTGISAVLQIAIGVVPIPGMTGFWYVSVPYMLSVILTMSQLWSLFEVRNGTRLLAYRIETTCRTLPVRYLLCAILSIAAFTGNVFYMIFNGVESRLSVVYAVLMIVCSGLAVRCRGLFKQLKWEPEKEHRE